MRIHRSVLAALGLSLAIAAPARAAEPDPKAAFFTNTFLSLCMRHLNDLEVLRADLLKKFPAFPPEQASQFLNGRPGDAWPIMSSLGQFVIALPKERPLCSVYARRAPQEDVEALFNKLVSSAPEPLVVEKRTDDRQPTPTSGEVHRLAYVWAAPSAPRKMMFALTTSTKEDAPMQALATAAVISE